MLYYLMLCYVILGNVMCCVTFRYSALLYVMLLYVLCQVMLYYRELTYFKAEQYWCL